MLGLRAALALLRAMFASLRSGARGLRDVEVVAHPRALAWLLRTVFPGVSLRAGPSALRPGVYLGAGSSLTPLVMDILPLGE